MRPWTGSCFGAFRWARPQHSTSKKQNQTFLVEIQGKTFACCCKNMMNISCFRVRIYLLKVNFPLLLLLFREKAAPKAKLRRKCFWNSPKSQSFQRFNFFRSRKDCEKNCLYEHQRRGKGCRRVENSCEICKHTRRKRILWKVFESRRKNNFISADRITAEISFQRLFMLEKRWRLPLKLSWMFNNPRDSLPLSQAALMKAN